MKRVLALAAVGEAGTGLALLIVPSLVARLLLGDELTGIALPVARVAGIALISLGLACWPRSERGWPGSDAGGSPSRALGAMLCYSLLVTLYLAYLGISGGRVGSLLWPAVAVHAILTLLLGRTWLKGQYEDIE
jgi:hypothetical protein